MYLLEVATHILCAIVVICLVVQCWKFQTHVNIGMQNHAEETDYAGPSELVLGNNLQHSNIECGNHTFIQDLHVPVEETNAGSAAELAL